jgi:hypothetical protein
MNLSTYLFKMGATFHKFFNIGTQGSSQHGVNYFDLEKQEKLRKQCKKATQEITYLKSFYHWPIAKSKQDSTKSTKH